MLHNGIGPMLITNRKRKIKEALPMIEEYTAALILARKELMEVEPNSPRQLMLLEAIKGLKGKIKRYESVCS